MSVNSRPELGPIGIWASSIRFSPTGGAEAAAEIEALGVSTLWVPGGIDSGVLDTLDTLLDATTTLQFATGILNVWKHDPADVVAWWNAQSPERQTRLFLGLGVSHGPIIGESWGRPLATMRTFLDGLDAGGIPRERLCLAALGPKMLELAASRTAGAHPYMVSVDHTRLARATMGAGAILAPELGIVLEEDAGRARALARGFVRHYSSLPNYADNWRRDGFSDDDIVRLSDRLIDALIAWGSLGTIRQRIDEHLAAGADHVCLQVIGPAGLVADLDHDRPVWRELVAILH